MSDASTSQQPPAGAARSARDERRHLLLVAGGILIALTLAIVLLRLQRLSELPPGLHQDEGSHAANALQVLRGEHAVFFPERSDGLEGLMAYAVALSISLLGRTVLALRLPTALASAGTVFLAFRLGRLLFEQDEESGRGTPWWGLTIGGAAAPPNGGFHQPDDHGAHSI
jgi:predicted membrane-bound mannosyltransferase